MQTGATPPPAKPRQFRLLPDTAKRVAIVPAELHRILNEDRSFRRWFTNSASSMRKWICDWVTNVKSPKPASAVPNKSPSSCSPP